MPDGLLGKVSAGTTAEIGAILDPVTGLYCLATMPVESTAEAAYRTLVAQAMSGDMVFVITPATVAPAPRATAWTRTVTITLENADGDIHTWFNGDLGTTVGDTSTAGTATIVDTTPPMIAGTCTVVVSGAAADWLNTETDTLTLANKSILGYTVVGGTSVATFTTP
jgi:hypothetical protein